MGIVHSSKTLFVPYHPEKIESRLKAGTEKLRENRLAVTPCENGFLVEDIPMYYRDKQMGPATGKGTFCPTEGGTEIKLELTASPYMEWAFACGLIAAVVIVAVALVASAKMTVDIKDYISPMIAALAFVAGCATSVAAFTKRVTNTLREVLGLEERK